MIERYDTIHFKKTELSNNSTGLERLRMETLLRAHLLAKAKSL